MLQIKLDSPMTRVSMNSTCNGGIRLFSGSAEDEALFLSLLEPLSRLLAAIRLN